MTMKNMFLVADAPRSAAVRAVVGHDAVVVVERPLLAAGADHDRPTPDGERLLAQIESAAKVVLVVDGGNPDDRLATALLVAAQQAGADTGRFWLVRPVAWRADLLAAGPAAARPLAEQVGPLVVRRRFARHFRRHLQRLLGTAHGPQGLALTPETLLLIFLLVGRQAEVGMFARPAGKTVLADLKGGGEARLAGEVDDDARLEQLAAALSGRTARVITVSEEECLLPPPAPYSFAELLGDAWRTMRFPPGRVAAACRHLLCSLGDTDEVRALVSSPWVMEEQAAPLAASLAEAAGKTTPPAIQAGSLLPLMPEKAPETLVTDLDSESASLYRLVHERFLAACGPTLKGVRLEGELECEGHRLRFVRQVFPSAASAGGRLAVGDTVMLDRCRLVEAEPPVVVPHDYASLAEEIRDFGMAFDIGLAMLLQEMLDRRYLSLNEEGAVLPGENSDKVARIMDRAFPAMRGINLSAYLEQTVAEVLTGRKELAFALHQFDATLQRQGKVLVAPKVGDLLQRRRRSANVIKGEELAASVGQPSPGEEEPATLSAAPEPEEEAGRARVEEREAGVAAAQGDEAARRAGAAAEQEEDMAPPQGDGPEGLSAAPPEAGGEAKRDAGETPPDEKRQGQELGLAGAGEAPAPMPGSLEPEEAADGPAVADAPVTEADKAGSRRESDVERDAPPQERGPGDQSTQEGAVPPDPLDAAVQTRPCPVCRRPMVLARDRFGEFWKCTGFPACRHQEAAGGAAAEEHVSCPLCVGGEVLVKATPSGKSLYVCSRPECRFMAWGRPHPEPCPVCGSPYLVEKQRPGGGMELRCPRAGCRYRRGLKAPEEGGEAAGAQIKKAASEPPVAPAKKKKRRIRVVRRKKKK